MRKSIALKALAFIMCVVTLSVTVLSVIGIIVMSAGNFYTTSYKDMRKDVLSRMLFEYAEDTARAHHYGMIDLQENLDDRNFYYELYDSSGDLVASNFSDQRTEYSEDFRIIIEEWAEFAPSPDTEFGNYAPDTSEWQSVDTETDTLPASGGAETYPYGFSADSEWDSVTGIGSQIRPIYHEYRVVGYLPSEYFTTDRVSFTDLCLERFYSLKEHIYYIGGASLLLFVIFTVMLCSSAGHKKGKDKPECSLFDKIPFDVFTAACASLFYLGYCIFRDIYFEDLELIFAVLAATLVGSAVAVTYIFSFAARAKTGELLRNTLIWLVIKNIIKALRFVFRGIGRLLCDLPALLKTAVFLLCIVVWAIFIMLLATGSIEISFLLLIFGGTILTFFASYMTYSFSRVKKGGERIAGGDVGHRIDTSFMPHDIKRHAESINNISGGLSAALEERLRSERLKTELITNVSHDLKTPLTSIVNYIDLLKNERASRDRDEAKTDEYIEVLERQSQRLKKLTEDLVEASKASTGNLEVNPLPIELGEMISQIDGEYSEKLASLGLELIIRRPEAPLTILADGKHLCRVFDNLMSNAAKYAQSGTRVYIDATEHMGRAYVAFRNTSRYELKISASELTERFVRGDASRHTEGSGLGLSIAQSLTELNGGMLEIFIDGDLFKVVLSFDIYGEKTPSIGE